jgi:hypothetical protein
MDDNLHVCESARRVEAILEIRADGLGTHAAMGTEIDVREVRGADPMSCSHKGPRQGAP